MGFTCYYARLPRSKLRVARATVFDGIEDGGHGFILFPQAVRMVYL
jgi:hypothetical protein